MSRRVLLVCSQGHPEIVLQRFVDAGDGWRWDDSGPVAAKFGERGPTGLHRGVASHTRDPLDRERQKVKLTCPRGCRTDLTLRWQTWTGILEDFATRGVHSVELTLAERYAQSKR